jgi:phage recombination protein Bet
MPSDIVRADAAHQQVARFSDRQLELITNVIAKGASGDELALFIAQCQRTGLDPFARQIYCIGRMDRQSDRKVFTTMVSIDGMRLIAQRSGEYAGQTPVQWCCQDGVWTDIWLKHVPPTAARVGVLRRGFDQPLYAVALWREYCPLGKDGKPTGQWPIKSAHMIAKCAESLALRKGFPFELSGLYSEEEMERDADEVAQPTAADRRADNSALFSPKAPAAAAPARVAPATEKVITPFWEPTGHDTVTILRVVPRESNVAALCECSRGMHNWVAVPSEMAGAIVEGKRVALSWEYDARGKFFRAVAIDRAPEREPEPADPDENAQKIDAIPFYTDTR